IGAVLTGIPVRRAGAMTGEGTLRGTGLPLGGLKEKLLAALRGGIKTVLIPKDNVKDLSEIPDNVKDGLELIPVASVTEVLKVALTEEPEAIDWEEPEVPPIQPGQSPDAGLAAH
ncbi:MAG: S16 family serine protease, partial [Pseudomonadota bacterium]